MKLTTNKTQLTNAVAIANSYVSNEGDFKGKIVITGAKSNIVIKATDYIQTIALKQIPFVSSDLTVDTFDNFSIDGKKLLTALKATKTDELILEISQSHLVIKSGRSKVKIEIVYEVQEIKISTNGNYLNIDSNLIADFKRIFHAVDSNNPKYELNGVLVQIIDGQLNLVATDTRRLSVSTCNTSDENMEIIVPKDAIQSMIKLFPTENVIAEFDDTTLTVKTQMITYSTKLINGAFPQWKRIIPSSYEETLTISRTKLAELIKEASLFEQQISINISEGKIVIKDKDNNTEIEDTVLEESVNISFSVSAKNILDFLSSYDTENVEMNFNGSNLPIILIADSQYKEVCMPIIVNNEKEVDTKNESVEQEAA